jgi:SAM-dependent methyltransferase
VTDLPSAELRDRFNLEMTGTPEDVDRINKEFYGRFTYPWAPAAFEDYADPLFWTRCLNQDLGAWQHDRIPADASVWIAGCGTNQAVYAALRMPQARVLGTDLSTPSLASARTSAEQLGLTNLELREGSLHEAGFRERFDYIACTGVIHHNADPGACLASLAAALKPGGVLELMVYNYFHRLLTTAYQKTVRLLEPAGDQRDFSRDLATTRTLVDRFAVRGLMGDFLRQQRGVPDAGVADALLQPVEFSYTVESLAAMADACGLDLLLPCISPYDRAARHVDWNVPLGDDDLDARYARLPDVVRWQIANLMYFNDSPMLWFYLQRRDSGIARRSEAETCERFLDTRFDRVSTRVRRFALKDGRRVLDRETPFPDPAAPPDAAAARVLARVSPDRTMRDVLDGLGLERSFRTVNRLRVLLTTTAFPYLIAVS